MTHIAKSTSPGTVRYREPVAEDGMAIFELVRDCKPLDENSPYCNLLQCDHFSDTCVVAEIDGEIAGWVSGYLKPGSDDTLFIWQVAVSDKARGRGLGRKMINAILMRDVCENVDTIQTTITRDNEASWALFRSFARRMGGDLSSQAHFLRQDHFDGEHATEHMVTIRLPEPARMAA